MTLEEAKKIYFDVREKANAFSLCYYLSSLDIETGTAPAGSFDYRSKQLSVLDSMIYDMRTADSYNEAVKMLKDNSSELEADFAHEIEVVYEDIEALAKIPKEEYLAYSELLTKTYPVYVEAKLAGDFEKFCPYLDKIFVYNRKYADWVAKDGKKGYDVLLDGYEKGYTTVEYDKFFDTLKKELVPFVKKITEKGKPPVPTFAGKIFSAEKQKEFCKYLGKVLCFDPEYTAMMESEHPFTTSNGNHDVRITNHYYEDNLISSIFSAIHEIGHGLYELQVDDKYEGTGCSGGTSLAMHESQSRLMENMIGRSRAFWETHFGKLQEIFSEELKDVTVDEFYRYVNNVECSLIRTEADELTYSLHVLIRYEIEKEMMRGELEASDVPAVWNKKYKDYLGVDVPNDREGCLQDMHWAGGSVGYFPTYSLGSAYAAQLYAAMAKTVDIDASVREGSIDKIAAWLKENVHRYGASKYPKDILRAATGEDFDPKYYTDYLIGKYSEIYGL